MKESNLFGPIKSKYPCKQSENVFRNCLYKSFNVIKQLQAHQTKSFDSANMIQTLLIRGDVCDLISFQVVKYFVLLIS